jgi:hypothetical protein
MPRDFTFIQTNWDDEDCAFGDGFGLFQNSSQLALDIALLLHRAFCQANEDCIGILDCLLYLIIPVLAGVKLLFIQPGIDPTLGIQPLVELTNGWLISRGVANKNTESSFRFAQRILLPFDEK